MDNIDPNETISEWDSDQQKVVTKDKVTYFADKYRMADKYGTKVTGFAVIAAFAALIAFSAYVNMKSTAKLACSAVKEANEVSKEDSDIVRILEHAFDTCHNHGLFKLPGD